MSSSVSAATGEADRAFRLGMQLEKAGLARASSAAFHEAVTLYQCFLDQGGNVGVDKFAISDADRVDDAGDANIFSHVTSLPASPTDGGSSESPTVLTALAYACIRLAHLSHDAFGDSRAAERLYRLAVSVDPEPSGVAYHGIGTSVESSVTHFLRMVDGGGGGGAAAEGRIWMEEMEKAVEAYREASRLGGGMGSNGEEMFHLAVALEVSLAMINWGNGGNAHERRWVHCSFPKFHLSVCVPNFPVPIIDICILADYDTSP